jgi:hypothetical protein
VCVVLQVDSRHNIASLQPVVSISTEERSVFLQHKVYQLVLSSIWHIWAHPVFALGILLLSSSGISTSSMHYFYSLQPALTYKSDSDQNEKRLWPELRSIIGALLRVPHVCTSCRYMTASLNIFLPYQLNTRSWHIQYCSVAARCALQWQQHQTEKRLVQHQAC